MSWSERELLRWLRGQTRDGTGVVFGIGDDAAVLQPPYGGALVTAADQTVEDVHFRRSSATWEEVGRKALARNLSDLAAMAARPWVTMVSAALPADFPLRDAQALFTGLLDLARQDELCLVGGDLCCSPSGVHLDVSILGCMEERQPLWRSGAQVGDRLMVTGTLGGSGEGHHLRFTPRWREAIALARTGFLHAAIDLSDGLARDAHHLAEESRVGLVFDREHLPRRLLASGMPASVDQVLHDGEDFELLLALDPAGRDALLEVARGLELTLSEIGEVTAGRVELRDRAGNVTELLRGGYEHRFDD